MPKEPENREDRQQHSLLSMKLALDIGLLQLCLPLLVIFLFLWESRGKRIETEWYFLKEEKKHQ